MADRHNSDPSSPPNQKSVLQERRTRERRQSPELHPKAASDTAGRPAAAGLTPQPCGECLAALAHRLSQPLTALRGSLELALRTELSAQESRAALEQAFELTNLVVRLVTSLRDLAEAAMAGSSSKPLSLRDLVKGTVEELRGLADSRGVKILLTASLEAKVSAPPNRLRETIAKLLGLVIQRSPAHGEIWLAFSAGGGSAGLLIADQGPSPRPGEFDLPSFRACGIGHLFAEAAKNCCLEWAALKVLAESLGGNLQAVPRQPQGCCFLLQLPLANAEG